MSKRLRNISKENLGPHMISESSLSFIMKNSSVFTGRIVSIESGSVKLKNSKGHVLHLPLDQIDEIWSEEKVA